MADEIGRFARTIVFSASFWAPFVTKAGTHIWTVLLTNILHTTKRNEQWLFAVRLWRRALTYGS